MDINTTLPAISLYAPDFIGFLLPPVITILNKDVQKESHRFLITMAICMLVAVITKYSTLQTGDVSGLVTSFGIVFTESQIIYKLYFKNSALKGVMDQRLGTSNEPDQPVG